MEITAIVSILESVRELSARMLSTPEEERIGIYRNIDPSLLRLEGYLRRSPNSQASEKLDELKVHLIAIARLDDPDEYSDEIHFENASRAIEYLRNVMCTLDANAH